MKISLLLKFTVLRYVCWIYFVFNFIVLWEYKIIFTTEISRFAVHGNSVASVTFRCYEHHNASIFTIKTVYIHVVPGVSKFCVVNLCEESSSWRSFVQYWAACYNVHVYSYRCNYSRWYNFVRFIFIVLHDCEDSHRAKIFPVHDTCFFVKNIVHTTYTYAVCSRNGVCWRCPFVHVQE